MQIKNPSNKDEQRCDCGKLLFKMSPHGLEVKCNRCKQIHLVPVDRLDKQFRNLCPVVDTMQAQIESEITSYNGESNHE